MAAVKKASAKPGGIRFAEVNATADSHSHVHFDEKLHDSVVMVIPESDGNFMVKRDSRGACPQAIRVLNQNTSLIALPKGLMQHLIPDNVGFLKTQHRYEIVFTLPDVPGLGKDVCPAPVPNPYLQIKDLTAVPCGGLKVTCEYMPLKEGVVSEEILIISESKEDMCLKVKVQARVMDRHHGTPMLLEGVRCVGVELEYDSEQSDWQGFD